MREILLAKRIQRQSDKRFARNLQKLFLRMKPIREINPIRKFPLCDHPLDGLFISVRRYTDKGKGIFVVRREEIKDVFDTLQVETDYNASTPGVYSFHYYAYDKLSRQGHTVLTVIVE